MYIITVIYHAKLFETNYKEKVDIIEKSFALSRRDSVVEGGIVVPFFSNIIEHNLTSIFFGC